MKMHIRKDDTVIVISGDDKGVKGNGGIPRRGQGYR